MFQTCNYFFSLQKPASSATIEFHFLKNYHFFDSSKNGPIWGFNRSRPPEVKARIKPLCYTAPPVLKKVTHFLTAKSKVHWLLYTLHGPLPLVWRFPWIGLLLLSRSVVYFDQFLDAARNWKLVKILFLSFSDIFLLLNQLSFCCTFTTDIIWDGFQYKKQPFLPNKVGKKEQDRQQGHDIAKYFTLMVLCLVI